MTDLLAQLNPMQQLAVKHDTGPLLLLAGCGQTTPEEVAGNLLLWLVFLIAMSFVILIGAAAGLVVLIAPPFAGLVSGVLLRRDASPRRRGFVVAVGFLNLSNFALIVWPWVAVVEEAMFPPVVDPELAPQTGDDALLFAIVFTALLVVNLAVGIYSLAVGLRRPEALP